MAQAAIAADLHQALDVHAHLTAKVALHLEVMVNVITDFTDVLLGQILDAGVRVDAGRLNDLIGDVVADAVDVRQGNLDSLLTGKVDACDTCHVLFSTSIKSYAEPLALVPAAPCGEPY